MYVQVSVLNVGDVKLKRCKGKRNSYLNSESNGKSKYRKEEYFKLKLNMRLIYGLTKSRSLKGFMNS